MSKRDLAELMRRIERLPGWEVRSTRAGHWTATNPDGRRYTCPGTPSDHRSLRNARAGLRRLGADV